jgi:hypothetical protein
MNKKLLFVPAIVAGMFLGNTSKAQAQESDEMVPVYRWFSQVDRNYVTVAEGEYQEGQLLNWKYNDKTLVFYAFREPGPNRVAVYRWFNPITKDIISVAEDEYSDDAMLKMGYKEKHIPKTRDWVTIPEEGDTDAYFKKGYRHKTLQYYGVRRSVDESIYNQPL